MILAEHRHHQEQQQQQQLENAANSVENTSVAIEIHGTPGAPNQSPETWRNQVQSERSAEDTSTAVVSVDVEDTLAHYRDPRMNVVCTTTTTTTSEEDDESDSSLSSTDDYDDEEDGEGDAHGNNGNQGGSNGGIVPVSNNNGALKELGSGGWITDLNGLALPNNEPMSVGDVSVKNSRQVHIGPRWRVNGPVTVKQIVYSTSVNEEKSSVESGECGEHREKDAGSAFGSRDGPKLSTGSNHPLFPPFPRGKVAEWFWTRRCTVTICIAALVLLLITVLSVWLTSSASTLHIVSRDEWGAKKPTSPPDPLSVLPPPYVIISHTVTQFCYTQAQCVLNVRVAQSLHMESKGWDDIAYNFLVGGDGNVYQGRGWDVEGAHTFNYNRKSIGVSFIGTFNSDKPTKAQLLAAQRLIVYGVEHGKIAKDYKLLGHRQCVKTESPGEVLYNIIKTWDHWSPTP